MPWKVVWWFPVRQEQHLQHRKTSWRMAKIDKSGLPGKYKCWIYQHGLLPRLMWLLTVYEVLLSTVEGIERKFNKHLRRWLGIPRALHPWGSTLGRASSSFPCHQWWRSLKSPSADCPWHIGTLETNSPGKQESEQDLAVSGPPARQLTRQNVLLGPKTSSETLALEDRV